MLMVCYDDIIGFASCCIDMAGDNFLAQCRVDAIADACSEMRKKVLKGFSLFMKKEDFKVSILCTGI